MSIELHDLIAEGLLKKLYKIIDASNGKSSEEEMFIGTLKFSVSVLLLLIDEKPRDKKKRIINNFLDNVRQNFKDVLED